MSSGQPTAPAKLRVAQVLRAHGVRGEVRVEPCGGDWTRFKPGTRVEIEDGSRALTVRTSRPGPGNAVLLGFDEVATPAAAAEELVPEPREETLVPALAAVGVGVDVVADRVDDRAQIGEERGDGRAGDRLSRATPAGA